MSNTFILRPENARDRFAAAWKACCDVLQFGKNVKVTVEEFKNQRSVEQNAKFHSVCGELSKSKKWCGQTIDTEGWKRLLVDAWARTNNKPQSKVVPSLDGMGVVSLGIQTRTMPVGDMCDLIEFAHAWCAENDVRLSK
jgi:NinB protein